MTITSPLTPTQEAKSLVDAVGSKLETEPGAIDVSWAEKALRDARRPSSVAVQEAAPRCRWLRLLVAAVVLCACAAIAAVTNVASPAAPGNQHRPTPSVVHHAPESIEPARTGSSISLSCPVSLLSHSGAHGVHANSLDPLSCTDTWPALLPVSAPTETQMPRLRRARRTG